MIGSLLSGVFAYIIQFFHMVLDYGAIEEVQFEDEDYFYYVRAVPKLKMTVGERTVKHIYTNRNRAEKRKVSDTTEEKVENGQKSVTVAKRAPQPRRTRAEEIQQEDEHVMSGQPQDKNGAAGMQQQQNGDNVAEEHKENATKTALHTQQQRNTGNRKRTHRSKHKNRKKRKR